MFSVIFDMDGTLIDSQRICIPAWDWAGEKQGICGMGKHIPAVCGMNKTSWSKYVLDIYPNIDIDRFNDEARQYCIDNLDVKFMPGIEQLLTFLKKNNIKMALASGSSRQSVNHHLKAVDAEKYFEVIMSGEDVIRSKPDPEIFLKTAELMGIQPKDCFVFEDSQNGVKAANAAGMKCIGIPDIVDFPSNIEDLLFMKLKTADEIIPVFTDLLNFL
ncbi:HAD family hydrolase [Methanobrevibacter sp.]|uniref:HAD family hydrolase n=1 Tax=Methanobrevibacter sp. TaxID=66852 RepID=UPI00388EB1BB